MDEVRALLISFLPRELLSPPIPAANAASAGNVSDVNLLCERDFYHADECKSRHARLT